MSKFLQPAIVIAVVFGICGIFWTILFLGAGLPLKFLASWLFSFGVGTVVTAVVWYGLKNLFVNN